MRFGRLTGFLGVIDNAYGFAVGRAGNFLQYDDVDGLQIQNAGGSIIMNENGLFMQNYYLDITASAPDYQDGYLVLYVDDATKTLKGKYKDGVYESEEVIHTF